MAEIIRHKEIIPVKLDQKDKKLIYELDFHSRDPCSKLSKRVNLSKQGEEYKINNFIKRKVESIATDVVHYRYRFPLKVKKLEEIHIKETDERVEIDEKDKKVLDLLAKNPRSSLVDMSKIINESAKVLSYRIKKLENKKLIEAYRPVIDYNSLGYTYYKIFINLNKVSKEELTGLKDFIKYHPLVI